MMDYSRIDEAAAAIRPRWPEVPGVAAVLGSGLGPLADRAADRIEMPYAEIPHFPTTTVAGHAGHLIFGRLGGAPVALLQGRFHHYEGHDLATATLPVRVLRHLGVRTLILTAAAGGIRPDLKPGDIVCLADHLNLLGANPLRGPNDDRLGPRFPDMTEVYSRRLRDLAAAQARALGIDLRSGVYACMPGPSYETPAEIRMLRTLGADVVGMSTVPEAVAARHGGMDVLAFALVSNAAAGVTDAPISHEEVLEAGRASGPRLGELIERIIGGIHHKGTRSTKEEKEN
jgi:purine-nucleoside phosphorylase